MTRPTLVPDGLADSLAGRLFTARELAEERRAAPPEKYLPTASPPLERLLGGGLRRGALVELVARRSCGRFSLVLAVLSAATRAGEPAALIDLGDGLEARSAAAAGIELERLLWVRPRRLKEALMSAEAILASGMPLVVLELGMPPIAGGRGSEAWWLRLARSARARGAVLLVASPYRVSGTAATTVLESRHRRPSWQGRGGAPRLLRGVAARLELVKGAPRREGETSELELAAFETPAFETPAAEAAAGEEGRAARLPEHRMIA